jgi:hypothetical protein
MALDGFRAIALMPWTSIRRLSKNLPVVCFVSFLHPFVGIDVVLGRFTTFNVSTGHILEGIIGRRGAHEARGTCRRRGADVRANGGASPIPKT